MNIFTLYVCALVLWNCPVVYTNTVISVNQGETADLACPQHSKDPRVPTSWIKTRDGSPISDGPRLDIAYAGNERFEVIGDFTIGEYNLRIKNVTSADTLSYTCIVVSSNSTSQYEINLTINVPPKNLIIQGAAIENDVRTLFGTVGKPLNINCSVISGIPKETLVLSKNGTVIATGSNGFLNYQFVPTRDDHMRIFACIANNIALPVPLTQTVTLMVGYVPVVKIDGGKFVQIAEGNFFTVKCEVDSFPATGIIYWVKEIESTHNRNLDNGTMLTFELITRRDSGNYTCTARNTVGTGSSSIKILVTYPPKVNIEYNNYTQNDKNRTFKCHATGIPDSYIFYGWEHKSAFEEHIRYLDGREDGLLVLPNSSPLKNEFQYEDIGYYTCYVSNGQMDIRGNENQSATVYLHIEGSPYVLPPVSTNVYGVIGEPTIIVLRIISNPKYTELMLKNDVMVLNIASSSDVVFTEERIPVYEECYGKKVKFHGYQIDIEIIRLSKEFVTNNILEASNGFGKTEHNFSVIAVGKPRIPANISLIPLSNGVIIHWSRSYVIGADQKTFIEYRLESDYSWQIVEALNHSVNSVLSWTIVDLQPSSVYFFRMYTENRVGRSNKTDELRVQTIGSTVTLEMMLYIITSGCIGLITVFTGAVLLFVCYRKKHRLPQTPAPEMNNPEYVEIEDNAIPLTEQNRTNEDSVPIPVRASSSDTSESSSDSSNSEVIIDTVDSDGYLNPYVALTTHSSLKSDTDEDGTNK